VRVYQNTEKSPVAIEGSANKTHPVIIPPGVTLRMSEGTVAPMFNEYQAEREKKKTKRTVWAVVARLWSTMMGVQAVVMRGSARGAGVGQLNGAEVVTG